MALQHFSSVGKSQKVESVCKLDFLDSSQKILPHRSSLLYLALHCYITYNVLFVHLFFYAAKKKLNAKRRSWTELSSFLSYILSAVDFLRDAAVVTGVFAFLLCRVDRKTYHLASSTTSSSQQGISQPWASLCFNQRSTSWPQQENKPHPSLSPPPLYDNDLHSSSAVRAVRFR